MRIFAIVKGSEIGPIKIAIVVAQGTITVTIISTAIGPHAITVESETRTMDTTRIAIVIGPPSTTGRKTRQPGMETTRNERVRALINSDYNLSGTGVNLLERKNRREVRPPMETSQKTSRMADILESGERAEKVGIKLW